MADIAAFRASLVRLGFSVPASVHITTEAGQDLLFGDLVDLVEDDITVLCNSVRRPGGTIPNPNAGAAPNIPVMIPNPGIPVSALAERRMKITTYLARLYARRIARTLTPANITIPAIRNAQVLMERDAVQKNPTDCHKIPNIKSMMEFLEDPDSFLTAYVGEDKVPYPYLYQSKIVHILGHPEFLLIVFMDKSFVPLKEGRRAKEDGQGPQNYVCASRIAKKKFVICQSKLLRDKFLPKQIASREAICLQ
jgi:hypothetical protein